MHRYMTLLMLLAALSSSVHAAPRTFVASYGNDANSCALTTPCRSFQRALTQTDAAGEIIVLDSAGYGSVAIYQSVSIIAPAGIYAGITAPASHGITINAPGIRVVLRGLDLNGGGTSGGSGIRYDDGAGLLIDRCSISGFANQAFQSGIRILASGATIANTIVRNNNRGGISIEATGVNRISAAVVDSRLEDNGNGGYATGYDAGLAVIAGADVTVRDTVATGNFRGFSVCDALGNSPSAALSVDRSLAARNYVGLFVTNNQAPCALRVSNSTITDNAFLGMEVQLTGTITSLGNNFVYNNANNETFSSTVAPK